MSRTSYNPDWIPPPGATIDDLLSRGGCEHGRTLLRARLGDDGTAKLLRGDLTIDSGLAAFLVDVIGLTSSFWLEREKLYRAALIQRQREEDLLGQLPVDEMRERSFIQPVDSHAEVVAEVVQFFGKDGADSCREHIDELPSRVRQKTSRSLVSHPGALAAWIRAGEFKAARSSCAPWSPDGLRQVLPDLRKLTRTEAPEKYLPHVKGLCQKCGVAFVVLRALRGCRARGVVRFLSPEKVMVLVSYRHLTDDQFWFSFFHELAHLLLHPKEELVDDDWAESLSQEELEADRYAADVLVPCDVQHELRRLRDARSIVAFARRIGVSRGVVVGQMQHRGILGHEQFNQLKVHYRWSASNDIEKKPVQ